jgi:hypothetical protein
MKLIAKKRRDHHKKAIREAKKRALDKNLKGLKAQLFSGGKHILN